MKAISANNTMKAGKDSLQGDERYPKSLQKKSCGELFVKVYKTKI